ncbi:hypothetical protein PV325_006109 [Microctonus aethiopoides]|nr:hypothetical protein PV325_006109 [Microctonus aethiopoides]
MRHGQRSPVDTYPNDPNINSTMAPYGWGQLTNKGRLNVYDQGLYLRNRYDKFLGSDYNPDKFWLQSSSADRTKMTAMILSSALWKPNEKQTFKPGMEWQPIVLHYWPRSEDHLLIIWNACPKLTMERMKVENDTKVKKINNENHKLYQLLSKHSGWPMKSPGDVANLYATLRAEEEMGISIPYWIQPYYPEKLKSIATFSYSMNCYNELLRRLAGGPFVKKLVNKMMDKASGILKPKDRKMFAYIAHDNTLVNVLSALNIWDGKDPDYNCMLMIELHEDNEKWNVQLFERNSPDYRTRPLTIPGCETICPLDEFVKLTTSVIPINYDKECKVDDPNYIVPPSPPA